MGSGQLIGLVEEKLRFEALADMIKTDYQVKDGDRRSGWRKSKGLSLPWSQVDFNAGEVRLWTSKNGEGRHLPLPRPAAARSSAGGAA